MLLTHSLSTGINHIKCTLLLLFLNNVAMIKLISDYTFKTGSHYSLHFFFFFFLLLHWLFSLALQVYTIYPTFRTLCIRTTISFERQCGPSVIPGGPGVFQDPFFSTFAILYFFFLAISGHVLCEGLQMRRTHLESAFEGAFKLGQSSPR